MSYDLWREGHSEYNKDNLKIKRLLYFVTEKYKNGHLYIRRLLTKFKKNNTFKKYLKYIRKRSFPGGTSSKETACQCKRHKRHGFSL